MPSTEPKEQKLKNQFMFPRWIFLSVVLIVLISGWIAFSQDAPPDTPVVLETVLVAGSRPQAGQIFRDTLSDGMRGPAMVAIPAGQFWMGSLEGEEGRDDDERRHQVSVDTFAIGQYEVTFAEYERFCKATNWKKPCDGGWGRDNRPVINVSWEDVNAYTEWLSQQTGKRYRLPTEAEWEYAARAGTTTPFWTGNCVHTDQANYKGDLNHNGNHGYDERNCGVQTGVYRKNTLPVGSFAPNPWKLYDTIGNVWEWTCSVDTRDYNGAELTCADKDISDHRAVRGGSWSTDPAGVRSANRSGWPAFGDNYRGFRLARSL